MTSCPVCGRAWIATPTASCPWCGADVRQTVSQIQPGLSSGQQPTPWITPSASPSHSHRAYQIAIALLLITTIAFGSLFVGTRISQLFGTATQPVNPYGIVDEFYGNWAGYVIHSNDRSVTRAEGDFTVPTISCSMGEARAVVLVGIDGVARAEDTMASGGVKLLCSSGSPSYRVVYNWGQSGYSIPSLSVQPSDSVDVLVSWSQVTLSITIRDITQDWSIEKSNSSMAPVMHRASAEWMVSKSDVSVTNMTTAPLASFDKVYFSSCAATVNGRSGPMGSFPLTQDTMVSSNSQAEARPILPLWNDGTNFSARWESAGP